MEDATEQRTQWPAIDRRFYLHTAAVFPCLDCRLFVRQPNRKCSGPPTLYRGHRYTSSIDRPSGVESLRWSS